MTSGQKVGEGGSHYYIIVTSYELTDSPLLERPACLIFLFYQACIGPFLSYSCSTSHDCRLVTQSGSSLCPTFSHWAMTALAPLKLKLTLSSLEPTI